MNKKILSLAIVFLILLSAAYSQNLLDNQYQKAGREYERQAQTAMNEGRYDEAAKFADLASIEYRKSRQYADMMLLKFRAANAINLAQRTITDVSSVKATADRYATEITQAKGLLTDARALYDAEDWIESRAKAEDSIALLKDIRRVTTPRTPRTTSTSVLPRYYTVVSRPENTDCYWNIAGMDGVYSDPFQWEKLWNANKDAMKDPDNPHLIFPGMIIEIPSLQGERREGTYDPNMDYSPLK